MGTIDINSLRVDYNLLLAQVEQMDIQQYQRAEAVLSPKDNETQYVQPSIDTNSDYYDMDPELIMAANREKQQQKQNSVNRKFAIDYTQLIMPTVVILSIAYLLHK